MDLDRLSRLDPPTVGSDTILLRSGRFNLEGDGLRIVIRDRESLLDEGSERTCRRWDGMMGWSNVSLSRMKVRSQPSRKSLVVLTLESQLSPGVQNYAHRARKSGFEGG